MIPTKATTRAICNSSVRQVYVPPKNEPARGEAALAATRIKSIGFRC